MNVIRYRSDIDGLRAFAVLAVFIYHLYPKLLPGGFVGVDMFFVISGYLITRILIREHEANSFSFRDFYIRRVKRILPVLFLVIGVVTLVAIISLEPEAYRNFTRAGRYTALQVSNFYFVKKLGYFDIANDLQPLLHTWSLAVEEQFYLIWPLIIFFAFRFKLDKKIKLNRQKFLLSLFIIVFILSFLSAVILSFINPQNSFYMFYTRGWEFAIGGIIALDILPDIKKPIIRHILSVIALIALIFSVVILHSGMNLFLGGYLIPCMATALFIYAGRAGNSWAGNLFSVKPWVAIGLISYSLYLWHWPLISFYKQIFFQTEISISAAFTIILIAFILSILSYYGVEQPCRKWKAKGYKILLMALIVMLASAFGMKLLQKQYQAPWRVGDFKFGLQVEEPKCIDKTLTQLKYREDVCDKPSTSKALLMGDSHASHYYKPVQLWSEKQRYSLSYLQYGGCPMLLGYEENDSDDKKCAFQQSVLKERFLDDENVKIVFIAQRYDHYLEKDKKFKKALSATIEELQNRGKKVILLGQVPLLRHDPNKYMVETILSQIIDTSAMDRYADMLKKPFTDEVIKGDEYREALRFSDEVAQKHNVILFKPQYVILSAIMDDLSLYRDDDHLSPHGVEYITPHLLDFLNENLTK